MIVFLGEFILLTKLNFASVAIAISELAHALAPVFGSPAAQEVVEDAFRLAVVGRRPEEMQHATIALKPSGQLVFHLSVKSVNAVASPADLVRARDVEATLVVGIDRRAVLRVSGLTFGDGNALEFATVLAIETITRNIVVRTACHVADVKPEEALMMRVDSHFEIDGGACTISPDNFTTIIEFATTQMIPRIPAVDRVAADAGTPRELGVERIELLKHLSRILLRTFASAAGRFFVTSGKMKFEVSRGVLVNNAGVSVVEFVSIEGATRGRLGQTAMSVAWRDVDGEKDDGESNRDNR